MVDADNDNTHDKDDTEQFKIDGIVSHCTNKSKKHKYVGVGESL